MPKIRKVWRVIPSNLALKKEMSDSLGISEIITQVLINRGITDKKIANDFLFGGVEKLGDPYLLKDMEKAVARIGKAIDGKEKIIIYGDYDVDGMTSSALLFKVLTDLGGVVDYYIPDRQTEGYGLNGDALHFLVEAGTDLLLTVDCGISAVLEIEEIKNQLDIIVTDHHQPPEKLPDAYAIINPKQKDCYYPDKNLAGVGVAFKLCQGLWQHYHGADHVFQNYLDLVAIGTVADIVSLTGENRILVKLGLSAIANTKNIGLQALMEVCSIDKLQIDTGKIGFGIAPRLNATGRMSSANHGVELLVTHNRERAQELATQLNDENTQRQAVEKEIQEAAEKLVSEMDINNTKVLVLVGENWHSGVIGIVASRLVEKYYRPVIIISVQDGMGKASCRSIAGFDIYDALHQCSDLLVKFGGHRQAAGLSILPEHINELREKLTIIATNCLSEEDYIPILTVDSVVSLREMNVEFLKELECLKPYGMGNPSPVFACENLDLKDKRTLGKEAQHLKLKVAHGNDVNDVVAWRLGGLADSLQEKRKIDVAFFPEVNEWQGRSTIQLRAHDVRQVEMTELDQLYILSDSYHNLQNSYEDFFASNGLYDSSHQKVLFQDFRGIDDKLKYILEIIKQKEKTVIVLNTPQEVYQLATEIRRYLPNYKEKIGVYHSGLHSSWKNKIENWFREDHLSILITTNMVSAISGIEDIRHLILYSLPLNMESLVQQCKLVGHDGKSSSVHLLFDQQESDQNQLLLAEIHPERIVVGQVYLVLKKNQVPMTDEQIAALVWNQYQVTVSQCSVRIAIEILKELQLLQYTIKGHTKNIQLLPQPQEKLDIGQSVTFRQGLLHKAEFLKFIEQIMDIPTSDLLEKMNES